MVRVAVVVQIISIVITALLMLLMLPAVFVCFSTPNGLPGGCMSLGVSGNSHLALGVVNPSGEHHREFRKRTRVSSTISAVFADAADVWTGGVWVRSSVSGAAIAAESEGMIVDG